MDRSQLPMLHMRTKAAERRLRQFVYDKHTRLNHSDPLANLGIHSQYELLVREYGHASMQKLATHLLSLPREIRDMMYEMLWSDAECRVRMLFALVTYLKPRLLELDLDRLADNVSIVNKRYVGAEIAREALKGFERHLSNSGSMPVRAEQVARFLYGDPFKLGITLNELYRYPNLNIHFSAYMYPVPELWDAFEYRAIRSLNAITDVLLTITPEEPSTVQRYPIHSSSAREIVFTIRHSGREIPASLRAVLRVISRAFHDLKAKGFDVSFVYENDRQFILVDPSAWTWAPADWPKMFERVNGYSKITDSGFKSLLNQLSTDKDRQRDTQQATRIWKMIMKDLYRVDEAVLINQPHDN